MDHERYIKMVRIISLDLALVGSRVTCDPFPTDTDQDVLVLTNNKLFPALDIMLLGEGFKPEGSCPLDPGAWLSAEATFQSYRLLDLNFIVTTDPKFYRYFMAATAIAKRFNLLEKGDRIALFQAVLYGNV